jgi:hypothetical protein
MNMEDTFNETEYEPEDEVVALVMKDGSTVIGMYHGLSSDDNLVLSGPVKYTDHLVENEEWVNVVAIPSMYMPFVDYDTCVGIKETEVASFNICSEHDARKYHHVISKMIMTSHNQRLKESVHMDNVELGEEIFLSGGANYKQVLH